MQLEESSQRESGGSVSRREFLEASAFAAGLSVLPRLMEQHGMAAEVPGQKQPAAKPRHPLEPLNAGEVAQAVETLRKQKQLGDSFRFVTVTLEEPPKAIVVQYQPGQPFSRRAFV